MDSRTSVRRTALALALAGTIALVPLVAAHQSGAGASAPQTPQTPTFRGGADYVEVDAVVVDAKGRFVSGLAKGDFVLLEDGTPQDIATFELVDFPHGRAVNRARAGAPDAVPSTSPPDAQRGGLYFLVFDDLHLTPESSPHARRLARDFASKYLGPADRAAVLSTSARAEAAQEITGDQKSISDAIGRVVGHKVESASVMGYSGAIEVTKRPGETNPGDYLRFDQARAALDTLTRVADVAASFRGERKALVLISSGMDVNISASADADGTDAWKFNRAGGNVPREIRDMVRAFIDRANRANLTVYAIDPRGMTQGGESATMLTSTLGSQTMLQDEVGQSHASLQALAMGTGGQAFVNTGNFDRAFRLIVDANSTYYLLSYSSNSPADGKFHRIELRATRPGLTVHARPGFVKVALKSGSGPSSSGPTGPGGGPSGSPA